ncbi:MAG: peptidase C11, partial [Oscillospiraceae bacterium]|nr:peptidase C11 [Oscillospiraceae bacterium]
MVYMCGTDLESQYGMGTADLKEMVSASISSNINLIVYTGGCKKWRVNGISNTNNQIWQIKNGQLHQLESNAGTGAMTDPKTLTSFIQFCKTNFPANRNMLIFWDHGGGSLSGYGYDERNTRSGS